MIKNIYHKYYNLKTFYVLAVLATLLLPCSLFAESVSVTAMVDKNDITLEDYILLRISVKGTRDNPELPEMPDFRVQSRGSSSQVSIVNGQMTSSIEYNYLLHPEKTGSYTIGPFYLKDRGDRIKSNKIRINIQEASAAEEASKDVFVVAEVDNDRPHIYQQIIYTFKFCRAVKIANASLTETPSFDGFIKEDLGKEKEYQKVINGRQFVVTEIKYALFPTKTGVFKITPSTLQCSVVVSKKRRGRSQFNNSFFGDSFFGFSETVPKVLKSGFVTVMVQPLPAVGKPPGFTNLVGNFEMTSSLSSKKVEKGESVTLTLNISGTGNLKNNNQIETGGLQNFKVYDDKPVFEPKIIKGKAGGSLVIKKALVPLVEGKLKIPEISFSFYNPDSGRYEKAVTGPYVMDVIPAKDKEKFAVVEGMKNLAVKQDVKILGKDILPIHTGLNAFSNETHKMFFLISLILLFAPVVLYFTAFLYKISREKKEEGAGLTRQRNAYKLFKKNIYAASKKLKDSNSDFYQFAQKILKDFIADRFNVPGNALTVNEMEAMLLAGEIPVEIVDNMKRIMLFYDSGQFGFKQYSAQEKEEIFDLMKKCVVLVNKKLKR